MTAAFGVVAACMFLSGLCVVTSRRLVRAVLWLALTLVATAALYAMLGASFLAAVQVLVYVGGVVTLMIVGVMVTRRHEGIAADIDTSRAVRAAAVSIALFAVVAYAILATPGLDAPAEAPVATTADLGRALLVDHVFSFEVISFLLLGAIVGAIVIARRRDPAPALGPTPSPKEAE